MQNSLSDLASLLRFLRVAPYNEPDNFDADITRLWKSGNIEEATKRLKRLLCCVLLRRAKATIELPQRHDTVCPLDFSVEERSIYDEAKDEAHQISHDALMAGTSVPTGYMNALQRINNCRMICNLGTRRRVPASISRSASPLQEWPALVQQASAILAEFGDLFCHHCGMGVEAVGSSNTKTDPDQLPFLTSCGRLICSGCRKRCARTSGGQVLCGHTPPCPAALISSIGTEPTYKSQPLANDSAPLPTKIAATVSQLKALDYSIKR